MSVLTEVLTAGLNTGMGTVGTGTMGTVHIILLSVPEFLRFKALPRQC